jgi:hypothetical protein
MLELYIMLIIIVVFYCTCAIYNDMESENMTGGQPDTKTEQSDSDQNTLRSDKRTGDRTLIYNEDFVLDEADVPRPVDPNIKYATSDCDFGTYNEDYVNQKENMEHYIKAAISEENKMTTITPPPVAHIKELMKNQQMQNELKRTCAAPQDLKFNLLSSDRYVMSPNYEKYGEDAYTVRSIENGKRAKEALDNRAMWGKNQFVSIYKAELEEHANSGGWWDAEELDTTYP